MILDVIFFKLRFCLSVVIAKNPTGLVINSWLFNSLLLYDFTFYLILRGFMVGHLLSSVS